MGFRRWLQKACHVALPVFHGRWFTPIPHQVPVKVLIGKPIEVPAPSEPGARPSDALVEEYHAKYVAALRELYDAHSGKPKGSLQVIGS